MTTIRIIILCAVAALMLLASAGCQQTTIYIYAPTFVDHGSRYEKSVEVDATDGKQMSDLVDADVQLPTIP